VIGAVAQNDMKRILSFHIVSQIGYMLLGLGLFTVAGLAGAVFFLLHQIPVKTSLFPHQRSGGAERRIDRSRPGGRAVAAHPVGRRALRPGRAQPGRHPAFLGFVGKLSIIEAGFGIQQFVIVGVASSSASSRSSRWRRSGTASSGARGGADGPGRRGRGRRPTVR